MSEKKQSPKRAFRFDSTNQGLFMPVMEVAAAQSEWAITTPYNNEAYALDDFNKSFRALVAAVKDKDHTYYDGHALVKKASQLSVPIAVISERDEAQWADGGFIPDLLIPVRADQEAIIKELSAWLVGLSANK